MTRPVIAALALITCCGFTTCQRKPDLPPVCPTLPVLVDTKEVRYVPVDRELTAPVPDVDDPQTYGIAVLVAEQRGAALATCNARLAAIRGIEGTTVREGVESDGGGGR